MRPFLTWCFPSGSHCLKSDKCLAFMISLARQCCWLQLQTVIAFLIIKRKSECPTFTFLDRYKKLKLMSYVGQNMLWLISLAGNIAPIWPTILMLSGRHISLSLWLYQLPAAVTRNLMQCV